MATTTEKLPWLEARIVGILVGDLKRAGWILDATNNDDGDWDIVTTAVGLKEELYQVEMLWARFRKGKKSHAVYLVSGNGVDLICDYTLARESEPDDFDATMDAICDRIERTYNT